MQKILVIEDEEAVRTNLLDLLEAENFKPIGAENGRIGIQLAQEHLPDLIICDIMMPELDGIGVLATLRDEPATNTIPFIFLTAKADRAELRQGMELGADDYLTKPFTPEELLQAIAARMTKRLVTTQLQQKVDQLEQLSTLKDDFLSTASHDLRAPLANMKTAIHLLRIARTEEQRTRYLDVLEAECDRETALLNDLLDLQRLEANAYNIALQPLELQTWVLHIAESFELRAQSRQLKLTVDVGAELPPLISDPDSLGRALTELLNNACKYTSTDGAIILTVHLDCTPGSGSRFIFAVKNQAEIPASDLPHIFDKFYRVPNAEVIRQSGTGLGLALVQQLIKQLGGTIAADSSNGWTVFTICLPVKPAHGVTSSLD